MNSGPNTSTSTSASSTQYLISSASYLKLNGTTIAPVFNTPKYIGSHSRQFIMRIPTLSPFCIPRDTRRLANLLAFSLNTLHVISLLYWHVGLDSMSSYSLHVTLLVSCTSGFISTRATSFPYSLAFLSK